MARVALTGLNEVPATPGGASFTFGAAGENCREITTIGLVGTLDSGDPVGRSYEVSALASLANPNFTFTPNGGKTISGPGGLAAATQVVNVQAFWRSVKKQSDGNWLLSGL